MRAADNRELPDVRRQWNRTGQASACSLGGVGNPLSTLVERTMVVRFQFDSDFVGSHKGFRLRVSGFSKRASSETRNLKPETILRNHFRNRAGANGPATLADSELGALLHCDGLNQFNLHRYVVTGHHHLDTIWQRASTGNVRRAEVELWPVAR